MEVFSEIMTLEEIAKYLKLGKSTLYKMAREGKIPAVKIRFIFCKVNTRDFR